VAVPLPFPLRAALLAALAMVAAAVHPWSAGAQLSSVGAVQADTVAVPALVGRTVAEAEALLVRRGLQLGQVQSVRSARAQGTVVRQSPGARTVVTRGTPVSLSVSAGPPADQQADTPGITAPPPRQQQQEPRVPQVSVPDLAGMSRREARAVLLTRGLVLGSADSAWADLPAGTVVAQRPAAGARVLPGSSVRVTLARAPAREPVDPPPPAGQEERVEVPDLFGAPLDQVRARLRGARLTLGGVDTIASTRPGGTVVGQQPAAGVRVAPGTAVSLALAQPALVTVPRVVGRTPEAAAQALRAAGLRAGAVDTAAAAGGGPLTVLRQRPAAGARVASGTSVVLVLAPGPLAGPTRPDTAPRDSGRVVPNVVGLTLARAREALRAPGLAAQVEPGLGDSVGWTVESQLPAAGARAAAGSAVRLTMRAPAVADPSPADSVVDDPAPVVDPVPDAVVPGGPVSEGGTAKGGPGAGEGGGLPVVEEEAPRGGGIAGWLPWVLVALVGLLLLVVLERASRPKVKLPGAVRQVKAAAGGGAGAAGGAAAVPPKVRVRGGPPAASVSRGEVAGEARLGVRAKPAQAKVSVAAGDPVEPAGR
jgi:beta-lactam-binding protein with PASTA domain